MDLISEDDGLDHDEFIDYIEQVREYHRNAGARLFDQYQKKLRLRQAVTGRRPGSSKSKILLSSGMNILPFDLHDPAQSRRFFASLRNVSREVDVFDGQVNQYEYERHALETIKHHVISRDRSATRSIAEKRETQTPFSSEQNLDSPKKVVKKSIARQRFERDLAERLEAEDRELGVKFHAKEVPATSKGNKLEEILRKQQERQLATRSQRILELKQNIKAFNFIGKDPSSIASKQDEESKSKSSIKKSFLSPESNGKQLEKKTSRAQDLLLRSSFPRGMSQQRPSRPCRCGSANANNFAIIHHFSRSGLKPLKSVQRPQTSEPTQHMTYSATKPQSKPKNENVVAKKKINRSASVKIVTKETNSSILKREFIKSKKDQAIESATEAEKATHRKPMISQKPKSKSLDAFEQILQMNGLKISDLDAC